MIRGGKRKAQRVPVHTCPNTQCDGTRFRTYCRDVHGVRSMVACRKCGTLVGLPGGAE